MSYATSSTTASSRRASGGARTCRSTRRILALAALIGLAGAAVAAFFVWLQFAECHAVASRGLLDLDKWLFAVMAVATAVIVVAGRAARSAERRR
jgi:hypothetical protein